MEFIRIICALSAGVLNTLGITLSAMAVGLAGGTALVLAHQLAGPRGRRALRGGTYVVQSVPALVLIFMAMFGLPRIGVFLPPFFTVVASSSLLERSIPVTVMRSLTETIPVTLSPS